MDNKELANLIFPDIKTTISDYENKYKKRELKEGQKVTRFAPSPTGFVHIGNFFQAVISFINAKNSDGIFFLRNEDTDQKREKEGAANLIMKVLCDYGFKPDEYQLNGEVVGNYGPYIQSERKDIYQTFVKHFIEIGRAYPCFCTSEKLAEMRENQINHKARIGYYGTFAKCRKLSLEEIKVNIENNVPYVIRFKSMGNFDNKVRFTDLVKGDIMFPENDLDVVIMKSDSKLPTYHFAHLVDDYLMGTTHVTRGEEWLSSVPLHLELFKALGVKLPKYIHNPLILKKDGDKVRKISKRKDPEASMSYYDEQGFPPVCVIESLMTIINSDYEQWRENNKEKSFLDFKFNPKKMNSSGALYDLDKLKNITKNYLSTLKAEEVYEGLLNWTSKYDKDFNEIITKYKDYTINILNIERNQKKPRKDYECYSDIKNHISYMFNELFEKEISSYEFDGFDKDVIKNVLNEYLEVYNENDNKDEWFSRCKETCEKIGFTGNMKEYKENPDKYVGNIAHFTTIIRVALTKKTMTPDLYEILLLLGKENIKDRFSYVINNVK